MKTNRQRRKRGYTLIELTVAMAVGLAIAAMTLTLAMQQFSFLRIFRAQEFLTYEAPVVNNFVVKLINRVDNGLNVTLHRHVRDRLLVFTMPGQVKGRNRMTSFFQDR